jgi:hypothetical protein
MAEWEEEDEPADLSQYEDDDLSIFRILAGEPPDRG